MMVGIVREESKSYTHPQQNASIKLPKPGISSSVLFSAPAQCHPQGSGLEARGFLQVLWIKHIPLVIPLDSENNPPCSGYKDEASLCAS